MRITRRSFLTTTSLGAALALAGCSGSDDAGRTAAGSGGGAASGDASDQAETAADRGWSMPGEEDPHERTWMCWPSSVEVWGADLPDVQDAIARVALAISGYEPVTMLARPAEVSAVQELLGDDVEVVEAPVDDLWARDTLPALLVRDAPQGGGRELAAGRVRFNGWGDKQVHRGDARLAAVVARHLDIELIDSGVVGEGGGFEIDGAGTVMAAESSWVNDNRNPDLTKAQIEERLLGLLGADRLIWVDGLAGHDITDGHIDTLARFASPSTILVDRPAFPDDDTDPWVDVAARTKEQVARASTADGDAYEVVEIVQPAAPRGSGSSFLSTYMNYYVCNGAVIAPEFGDAAADAAAREVLADLFPEREVVQVDIDALAAGGGGIHCATQQQPVV